MTKRVLCLFDVDGTLTVARKVCCAACRRCTLAAAGVVPPLLFAIRHTVVLCLRMFLLQEVEQKMLDEMQRLRKVGLLPG